MKVKCGWRKSAITLARSAKFPFIAWAIVHPKSGCDIGLFSRRFLCFYGGERNISEDWLAGKRTDCEVCLAFRRAKQGVESQFVLR